MTTVRFKPCGCGVLEEEPCDCAAQLADLDCIAARPIYLRRRTAGTDQPENGSQKRTASTARHQANRNSDD